MLPIIAGWLISIPLAVVISHPGVGRFFIAMGMFEGAGDEIRGRVAERDAQGMKASKASIRPKVEAGISG